jgi:hypothetical protein
MTTMTTVALRPAHPGSMYELARLVRHCAMYIGLLAQYQRFCAVLQSGIPYRWRANTCCLAASRAPVLRGDARMTREQPGGNRRRAAAAGKTAHSGRRGAYSRPIRLPSTILCCEMGLQPDEKGDQGNRELS